jgi:L-threonylcarbamoyladenylate synthase
VAAFGRCMAVGGVALFPADTVYGLACGAISRGGSRRLYELKGRPPDRPSAVMFFALDAALEALVELGPATRSAIERLLPGPLTLVLPNPARRYPLACGPKPERLGLRVPALTAELAPMAAVARPVLQSSANPTGGRDARRLADVDARIRRGVDLELDGGDLPGTASTVVELTSFEGDGTFSVLREGAVAAPDVRLALLGSPPPGPKG